VTASFYRERPPDGPFAPLIAVAAAYPGPENHDPGSLKELAGRDDVPEMRVLRAGLRDALGDPGWLPAGELSDSVEYGDGNDEAFLRRLWHDLYEDEPAGPSPGWPGCPPGAGRVGGRAPAATTKKKEKT
jgi:hypothetical protein